MEYIYIGEIVNTHGIKGELRILSDFKYKEKIFKENFKLYVGSKKEELTIKSTRYHKIYDMVLFNDINDINAAIIYKGDKVYINKCDLKIDGYLNEDLIGLDVYGNSYIGKVKEVIKSKAHEILVVENQNKKNMIPNIKEFIKNVDLKNKRIDINEIEGLINEN